jgi:capsular exopolysaccharide synthesis family protein
MVAAGALLGLLVARLQTPVFRAETLVEVRDVNPDFLDLRQARPFMNYEYGADLTIDMETNVEVLKSEEILRNTIDTLAASSASHPDWRPETATWSLPGVSPAPLLAGRELLAQVARSLYVTRAGATKLIRIQADAPNPVLAADFANALVRQYMNANIAARAQIERDAEYITGRQLSAMRSKIAAEEESLQKYAGANQLFRRGDHGSLSDDRLKQLQSDLLQARADLAARDAEQRVALSRNPAALPAVINDVNLRALQAQLIDLRRKEAELTTVYAPEHTQIQQVRAAGSQLEAQIQQETSKVVASIDGEYQLAKQKENTLASAYDAAVHVAESTSQAAVQYDLLEKDVEADLATYQRILSQAKSLNLASAVKAANLLIPQPAVPPGRPLMPHPARNVIMGLFASLVLGVALIVSHEHFDKNVQLPGDLTAYSGAAELGVISSIFPGSAVLRHLRNVPRRLRSTDGMNKGLLPTADEPVADDFRSVAASLLWSSGAGPSLNEPSPIGGARVIVITSAAPGEGKTTVTANLGLALTRAGRSLLLIDGDVRRPRLHALFGLTNRRGLTDILKQQTGDVDADFALQQTAIPGLSLLSSGLLSSGADQDASIDVLFQPGLVKLIACLRSKFDFILVDSPPMRESADARSLANAADGVILIARSRRTAQESVRSVCERLRLDGARLFGVILNDFKAGSGRYKYYA